MRIPSVVTILTVMPRNAGGDSETRSLCRNLKVDPASQASQSTSGQMMVGTRPPSKNGLWYIPARFDSPVAEPDGNRNFMDEDCCTVTGLGRHGPPHRLNHVEFLAKDCVDRNRRRPDCRRTGGARLDG